MDSPPLSTLSKTHERALLAGLILLGWAFIILARLFTVAVVEHDSLAKMARAQQERLETMDAPRGTIYDRNGEILAQSYTYYLAVVNPKRASDKEMAVDVLAGILGQDARELRASFAKAAAAPQSGGYLVVANNLSEEQAVNLEGLHLDWLEIRRSSHREYPAKDVAAHVVGNVDWQGKGVSGIERKLDPDLAATPGLRRIERDGNRNVYASEIVKTPVWGKNVGLTIDSELAAIGRDALKQAVQENHADHGSLVAMNPRNGEILVLENFPSYDPNEHLAKGKSDAARRNLAVGAPFEPGSVFKIVTLAAALETTELRPNTPINCGNGVMHIKSRVIHDSHPHSVLSMQDVLALSSNIGAIKIGQIVGNNNLYAYIRRFGFGQRTGIELPGEHPGTVRAVKHWNDFSIGSVPMGHEVGVTSVQLAQMGSVIANGGFLVAPHLVAWEQAPGGPRVAAKVPPPTQVLRPETAMTMRQMMRRVITEPHGTGHRLHVIGYSLAGKTGTAQIYDYDRRAYTHRYNASFLGFAPVNNPAIVIVVTVSGTTGEAGFGGSAAGPVFVRLMSAALSHLGVVRDVPQEVEELSARERKQTETPDGEADSDSVAELSTPLSEDELQAADGIVAVTNGAPAAPDFTGKTVGDVMREAAAAGIKIDMFGDGLARAQFPPAGTILTPGAHVRVRFQR